MDKTNSAPVANEAELSYRSIVENSLEAILLMDGEARIEFMNKAAEELTGYTLAEAVGRQITITYRQSDEDIALFPQRLAELKAAKRLRIRRQLQKKDGTTMPIEVMVAVMPNGKLVQFFRDITAQVEKEKTLEGQRTFLEAALDNLLVVVAITNPTGIISYINSYSTEISGYSKEELIGKSIFTFIHPEDVEAVKTSMARGVANASLHEVVQYRFRVKDGTWRYYETVGSNRLNDPKIKGVLVATRDISEQHRAQYLLKRAEEIARIGTYVLDIRSGIWTSSEVLDNIFGIKKEDPHTVESWLDLMPPEEKQVMRDYLKSAIMHGKFDKEYRIFRREDGRMIWVHGYGAFEKDDAGQTITMTGVIQDITETRATKQEASHAQELENLNRILTGREIRMIELKKENKELREKLKQLGQ